MIRAKNALCLLLIVGFTSACRDSREGSALTPTSPRSSLAGMGVLPIGVSVPPGKIATALPEPYSFARYGPLLPNSTPDSAIARAMAAAKRNPFPRRIPGFPAKNRSRFSPTPSPPPGTGDRGWFLFTSAQKEGGIYFVNDAGLDVDIPASVVSAAPEGHVTIYAPTHLSAGGACMEATTTHQRVSGYPTLHYFGFWDWCRNQGNPVENSYGTNWGDNEQMGEVFQSKYVRTLSNGRPSFLSQVWALGDGCWEAEIYNWTAANWEYRYFMCGPTRNPWGTVGWTMWESYGISGQCPVIASVGAWSILTRSLNNTWYGMDVGGNYSPIDQLGSCFSTGAYSFTSPTVDGGNAWRANTPNP